MRAGKLDRRLTIQRETETGRNEFNEPVTAWTKVATVWAQQRPNRGSERFDAAKVDASAKITFHIRYLPGFRLTDRVLYKGRVWNVTDIRELGREVVHEFDCIASVN